MLTGMELVADVSLADLTRLEATKGAALTGQPSLTKIWCSPCFVLV